MLTQAFLPALMIFLLAFVGMAAGVILSNRRLSGSCGGLSSLPGVDQCGACGRDLRKVAEDGCGQQADRS